MTHDDGDSDSGTLDGRQTSSRRRFLAASSVTAVGAVAGCLGGGGGNGSDGDPVRNEFELGSFQGSGPFVSSRPEPSGTSIRDLPEMSGRLGVALGGGEGGLYIELFELLEEIYPNLTIEHRTAPSTDLANTIRQEAEADSVQQDIFLSVDAGSLGVVADAGATQQISADAISAVPSSFKDGNRNWVGVAGRARAVPYNTNELSASDIPSTVADFPDTDVLQGSMGWAPSYGAFQSFITAMRLINDDQTAVQWLEDMQSAGVTTYGDEFQVSQAVADGELKAGFANHYYALRVKAWNDDPPIDLAFTEGDAGALVNVSGAAVLTGADDTNLATNFVRHLLSAEAQEFFATRTYAYPMIPGVQPVGDLPTVDELDAPDIDLTELSDRGGTLEVMREAGLSI